MKREAVTAKKARLEFRCKAMHALRSFFYEHHFLEIETPIRIEAPAPEEHIEPVMASGKYLITSPELQMKRLLAAGFDCIYQVCPVFRANEKGHLHREEFRMLEWYRKADTTASNNWEDVLIADCENLLAHIHAELQVPTSYAYQNKVIDFTLPWRRMSVREAFEKYAGWNPEGNPDPERFYFDLVDKVEPQLPTDRPLFLTEYPAAFASLAQLDPKNKKVAQRFELYIGGIEIANAYGELYDADEQRLRFNEEARRISDQGKIPPPLDEDFLTDLPHMGSAVGIALGLDRLMMILTDAKQIDDVVAF